MSRPLAVLRPEPGNAATATRIEAAGHVALRIPLFDVRPVAWLPPDPADYDSLVLSSANAVRHGGLGLARLAGLPVHAVGDATAAVARRAGLWVTAVGSGGVEDLAPPGRVLRLAGREHRALPGSDTIIVYASNPLRPDLTPLAGAVALIHSPRAGAALAALAADRADTMLAVLSPACAAAAGDGWRAIAVAERPTDAALVAAAIALAD
ncbi:uroporphyrinogen-III synthase [Sphingomonas sp.]|uniref:uroporphyrinogen-III synthase n=1 Tax=Sphingomonas sp. TaxID=28214 RepID=UPI002DD6794A|nr:uroporphyrinogen-III synthase [Sphingomonas sp.]